MGISTLNSWQFGDNSIYISLMMNRTPAVLGCTKDQFK